jgi:hypothetical protein
MTCFRPPTVGHTNSVNFGSKRPVFEAEKVSSVSDLKAKTYCKLKVAGSNPAGVANKINSLGILYLPGN